MTVVVRLEWSRILGTWLASSPGWAWRIKRWKDGAVSLRVAKAPGPASYGRLVGGFRTVRDAKAWALRLARLEPQALEVELARRAALILEPRNFGRPRGDDGLPLEP